MKDGSQIRGHVKRMKPTIVHSAGDTEINFHPTAEHESTSGNPAGSQT